MAYQGSGYGGYNNQDYGGGYGGPQGHSGYQAPHGAPQGHTGYKAPHGGPPSYGSGPPSYGSDPGPGGFATRPPLGPPPGADPKLWSWFTAVDHDHSGHITVNELKEALINGDWTAFDLDTVKLLMSIFDVDRSGTIGFSEFAGLWKYISDWQGVFRHFDRDRSGSIDGGELSSAFQQFGYQLNSDILRLVQAKYDPKGSGPSAHGAPQGITFDRFVRACVVVKQITEAFQRRDVQRNGVIQMNYDEFMHIVLSLP